MKMYETKRNPGFRLNGVDIVVVGVASFISFSILTLDGAPEFWWLPLYGAFSMFLFCNVLRISTQFEIPWIIAFSVSSIITIIHDWATFPIVILCAEPFRFIMLIWAIRIGRYRGIFWRQILSAAGHDPTIVMHKEHNRE
jgi:hypothetical protein